ncbi:MAG TPA: F0F1 ATP synthase subunit A [Anaerolineae bacterium]|nr:F0F1 ATP synthase subunit A [Anaerolineae bacterium]
MDVIVAEPVFWLFGVPVRNSVISTWVLMVFVIVGVILIRRRTPILLEMLIDFVENLASGYIPGKVEPYVPFLGSLLLFIAVANLSGILPLIFTPTRDINTPLALALVVFVSVFAFRIRAKGLVGFVKSFLSPLLPLDLIGYLSRTMSLTLRLFGNVIGNEIVVGVLFMLVPIGVPLVMVAIGSITGLLQAYVFTVLASSYIGSSLESA